MTASIVMTQIFIQNLRLLWSENIGIAGPRLKLEDSKGINPAQAIEIIE